jgi:hypothetical protein
VVVSYFYYTFHRGSYRNNPWTRHLPYFLKDKYFKWRYFEEFAYKTGKEWSEFVFETLRLDPLVIRYEDLHIDPLAELRRVATRFDLPFHKEIAEKAVGFCDFSRWQQRERQASDTAKKNGERFFRSGETGQWKEHFSDKMLNRFSDIVQPVASKLGYELHL